MKNFDDFLDFIKQDPDNNIHEITANLLSTEIEDLRKKGTPENQILIGAMGYTLKSFSTDLLRRYHEWLHTDES